MNEQPDSTCVINAEQLGKAYLIYDRPQDRLKQMLWRGRRQFYTESWVLRDIFFRIEQGEAVGIIGRNGSGKSTLLKLLCGTLEPSEGNCQVTGRVAALLELGAGFNPEFTGRENVYFGAAILGLTNEQIEDRFDSIAAFADIGEYIERPVKHYSSGMFLRLAFAVVAHVDADVLVIDEALAVGDIFFVQKCMRFIREFRERGTLLFVSHSTHAVINLCDKAIWLDRGGLRQMGSAKEVCESYTQSVEQEKLPSPSKAVRTRGTRRRVDIHRDGYDQRLKFINCTPLRNDIELFPFSADAPAFGAQGAVIEDSFLLDEDGRLLAWVVGGEKVTLVIHARCAQAVHAPVMGFFVKDHLGQNLFGDNSYITTYDHPLKVSAGQMLIARFTFTMPILPVGDYTVDTAIAEGGDGSEDAMVMHAWYRDVIAFKSHATSTRHGLVGLPMEHIEITVGD